MSSGKRWPSCLGLNVLSHKQTTDWTVISVTLKYILKSNFKAHENCLPLHPQLKKVMDKKDGLVQDYSNSFANALELLQSCTKPLK